MAYIIVIIKIYFLKNKEYDGNISMMSLRDTKL